MHPTHLLHALRNKGAYGRDNAIQGAVLAKGFDTDEKGIQNLASELRRQGFLIGAWKKGFFICMSYDEAYEYVKALEKRVEGANKTIEKFWEGMKDAFPDHQTELEL